MIEVSLSSGLWMLKGFWPWVPLQGRSMETGDELMGVTDWIPATVPGGVHADLWREGLIPDPYTDLNSLQCEWVEHRWWLYKTAIDWQPEFAGKKVELVFKGIDYEADVYAGGIHLGRHRGMFHPAIFDVSNLVAEGSPVEIKVLLRHPPDEMGQIGKTSLTTTQKSRFGYKWDFGTRLVNIGLWDDVVLRVHEAWSLSDIHVTTDVEDNEGIICLCAQLSGEGGRPGEVPSLEVVVENQAGEKVAGAAGLVPGHGNRFEQTLLVANPALWYPNGHGGQPLYKLSLILRNASGVLDSRSLSVGIRRVSYERNEQSPDDSLPYTIVWNGKKIYLQGVNLTPLDHLYGNVTRGQYEWLVGCMVRGHINLVRVWGGGIVEKEYFYDLCDRHGILVWQEFIQSSSGIDNMPSRDPGFLELLEKSAESALKGRRNHVCLAVWSGGNELMDAGGVPCTLENPTLALLGGLVKRHDPVRLFLPTSASGPVEHMTPEKGVMHDVHGHWKYQGNPGHYELYGNSDCLLHSEFGVDGCSDAESLEKFLSPGHRWPVSMADSPVWRHHGEWWDTHERTESFFGPIGDLRLFCDCSQWIQAEGLRFILEANRRRQFANSGSIIWQLNEPWPNVSCTNLVDYYGNDKMAFHWAAKAFAPRHVSLDYRRLNYLCGEEFCVPVFVHNHLEAVPMEIRASVLTRDGRILHEKSWVIECPANGSFAVGDLRFPVAVPEGELFFVRLLLRPDGRPSHENTCVFSTATSRLFAPALRPLQSELGMEMTEGWSAIPETPDGVVAKFRVTNAGSAAALFVRPHVAGDSWWMAAGGAWETIFPGEAREVTVQCRPKQGAVFEGALRNSHGTLPIVRFRALGDGAEWEGQE